MPVTITPTDDSVMEALGEFLDSCVPDGVVVQQGQPNRVAEPGVPDFIIMTPSWSKRLSTNEHSWSTADDNPTTIATQHDSQYDVQLDFHGPQGKDLAVIVATLFRDPYACDMLAPAGIAPLDATDGQQMPFINGANQYENRWVMTISLQIKPIVSTPMQFADTLDVTISSALGGV